MRMSSAPALTSWSITSAIFDLSTIELTPTHSGSSRGEIVGARRPGVTAVAVERVARRTLYWHTMYLRAAITPAMRPVILSMSGARCACFDFVDRIRTASECSSVAMGRRPAARIVSPDSGRRSVVARSEDEKARRGRAPPPHGRDGNGMSISGRGAGRSAEGGMLFFFTHLRGRLRGSFRI